MDWGIILDQRERANDYKGWKIHDKFKRSLGSLGDYICNQETFLNNFRPIKKAFRRYWWRILKTIYVGYNMEVFVTDSVDCKGNSDVGDIIMLVTFFVMLVIFSMYKMGPQHPESVTNISNLSPTHLVSNIRHQHRCNP